MDFVAKNSIDWSAIQAAYFENRCSIRALALAHNLTEGAIRKRAKRGGWVRTDRPKCAVVRTEADRSREKRKRDRLGVRLERVALRPGEMVVVLDVGSIADRLGVAEWDSESADVVRERLKLELEKLVRTA